MKTVRMTRQCTYMCVGENVAGYVLGCGKCGVKFTETSKCGTSNNIPPPSNWAVDEVISRKITEEKRLKK
jgi:hypothetical protein